MFFYIIVSTIDIFLPPFHRNIWDGSLAVEQIISRGNQTVSIVSILQKLGPKFS